jgi:hypothetical protein
MRKKLRFRPGLADQLESRLVLAQFSAISPAAVAPLNLSGRVRALNVAAVDQINVAFDHFTQDFLQAQGAYFATTPGESTSPAAVRYFRNFILQRIDLLGQELTGVFTQLPGGTRRVTGGGPNGSILVQSFLRQRITGNGASTLSRQLAGSNQGNFASLVPSVGTTGSEATLYTSSALTSIATARAATINASGYLLKSTFNKHKY